MNSQAKSDTSMASCMHCATQLMPYARVCPCCGEDPCADNGLADGSWFDEASVNAPNDPVLETMMAIAAARPKVADAGDVSFLPPGAPAPVRMPSVGEASGPALALAPMRPLPRTSTLHRRVLIGVAAVSVLAAMAAGLLSANGIAPRQPAEPKTDTSLASAAVSQAGDNARHDGPGDPTVVSVAAPEPLPQAPLSGRPEADARTIATALGLPDRPEASVPAPVPTPTPRVAPLAGSAVLAPGGTGPSGGCSEALAALALCGKP